MKEEEYENIKKIIYRNLLWKPKGNFPYYDEKHLKEVRMSILREVNELFREKSGSSGE